MENEYSSDSDDSDSSSDIIEPSDEVVEEIEPTNMEKSPTDDEYPSIDAINLEDAEEHIPRNDNHDQRPFIDKVNVQRPVIDKVLKKETDQAVAPSITPEEIKKRVSRMKKESSRTNYNRNVNKGKKDTSAGFW